MKDWVMIHKIKAMHDRGDGLSIKAISQSLGVSRNTVRKYLRMDEKAIQKALQSPERYKALDQYRDYLIDLLRNHAGLKTPKIHRKLKAKMPDLNISERSLRRYLERLKPIVGAAQPRYYEPVIDDVPGVQCQVDGGELRDVQVGGVATTVYFWVFVLSYSRLMYVSFSKQPVNTDRFIQMHDEAFRYFQGVPEECVYDQTKLVVISEQYREVTLNERFYRYVSQVGVDVRVCEGHDPESKGKVESGVKYVKGDGLCGEVFSDWQALLRHTQQWLEDVANARVHGTTGKVPRAVYEAHEQATMKPYVAAGLPRDQSARKADKTGLISFRANKYSVPMAYQRSTVLIEVDGDRLCILDALETIVVATHTIVLGKGLIVKNTDHYRDGRIKIVAHEEAIKMIVGDESGSRLCALLKLTSPKIYKDQVAGARQILTNHAGLSDELITRLLDRPRLTATQLLEYIEAFEKQPEALRRREAEHHPASPALLSQYAVLMNTRQSEVHCE